MFPYANIEWSSEETPSLLRATLESTADGILVVDRAGRVAAFNTKFAELWRIPDALLATRDDAQLLDHVRDQLADADAFLAKVRHLYETPEATSFDLVVLRDGRAFERYSQPQRVDREVKGRVWSFRDVTARLRAERDRQRAEARLRVILEHVGAGIAELGRDGRFLFVNRTLCQMLGYREDELLARTFLDVTHPDDRDRHTDVQQSALSSGEMSYGLEKRYLHKDGRIVWGHVSVSAVQSESGAVDRFVSVVRDITESKRVAEALRSAEDRSRRFEVEAAARVERERGEARTREAEQLRDRLASMLEATPDFVGYADAFTGHVLYVNKAGRRMCGVPDDEDVTKLCIADFHPAWTHKRLVEELLPAAAREGACSAEVSFLHRDGHEIPTLMILMAHRGMDGKIAVFSNISRDITDRKRSEEVQRKLSDEQAARTAAEEAVRARDDFVATAGHELKTPLTSLLMHISSMQRALLAGRPADFADRVDKLARSGRRLSKLIDELLDVSRITAGRLRLEPEAVELTGLAREVVAGFADESARTGSTISVRPHEPVRGSWDRLRIDQVITNLLSNAIKYGRGMPIEIEIATEGGDATVRVTDHGIGIDDEHKKKLFSRFERAVSAREYGGFGLGLWIARQIVEASGGTIDVESAPDRGSTFAFRLPLEAREGMHALP